VCDCFYFFLLDFFRGEESFRPTALAPSYASCRTGIPFFGLQRGRDRSLQNEVGPESFIPGGIRDLLWLSHQCGARLLNYHASGRGAEEPAPPLQPRRGAPPVAARSLPGRRPQGKGVLVGVENNRQSSPLHRQKPRSVPVWREATGQRRRSAVEESRRGHRNEELHGRRTPLSSLRMKKLGEGGGRRRAPP
jgi:hypothetical protein